jgi:hypothetical protein
MRTNQQKRQTETKPDNLHRGHAVRNQRIKCVAKDQTKIRRPKQTKIIFLIHSHTQGFYFLVMVLCSEITYVSAVLDAH